MYANVNAMSRADKFVVTGVSKSFTVDGTQHDVLRDVSFSVQSGEVVCIVGPSGTGKSTLLRITAGLTTPSTGSVVLDGQEVTGPPPGCAVVFQDYSRSLMPWLKVAGNVRLPLVARGDAKVERNRRTDRALTEVGLARFSERYPWQLSGGMQQRVAIARALAYDGSLLLMDEPFASVDAQTRSELEDLLLTIRSERETTVVLVTHDIDESVYLADRVLVIRGTPASIVGCIEVPLPRPRDQHQTKADPRFALLRTEVLDLVRGTARNREVPD